jgi:hypothetical protein
MRTIENEESSIFVTDSLHSAEVALHSRDTTKRLCELGQLVFKTNVSRCQED